MMKTDPKREAAVQKLCVHIIALAAECGVIEPKEALRTMKTIGRGLSERKRRQMISEAQSEATDSAGNFDPATFGTALARRGLGDEARPLIALGQDQKLLRVEQRRRRRNRVEPDALNCALA